MDYSESIKKQIQFIHEKIDQQTISFKEKRNLNRSLAIFFRIITISLSFLVTILLGLNIPDYENIFSSIAFIISAILSTLGLLNDFFGNQKMWITYNLTFTELKALKDKLEFITMKDFPEDTLSMKLDEIFFDYQNVLNKTNQDWEQNRTIEVDE